MAHVTAVGSCRTYRACCPTQCARTSTRTGGTSTRCVRTVASVTHGARDGDGQLHNIPRVLPDAVRAHLNAHWRHEHPCVRTVASVTHGARDGGGQLHDIPRVLPDAVRALLNAHWRHVHPVFAWIADTGAVEDEEMLRTFNCGLGMVLIVAPENQADVMNSLRGFGAMVVGSLQARRAGGERVLVDNFASALDFTRRVPLLPNKRVAVLVSGNGSNLQALVEAAREPALCTCADIALVISNRADAYALKRAAAAGIPSLVFNHKEYSSREEFDRAISEALEKHKIDIVCLAGFLRILSAEFVDKWRGRLVNIHPSLLPRHPGLHAQRQCLAAGDTESGCTVHFVDHGVDTGPIITQERVPVLKDDTEESLSERIHQAEHRAYPRALRLLATGRVRLAADGQLIWHS
ncbi:unnamed protein product [Parnassius apollo]|uniref:phosphoribosylglycinamide formyltransferase 1 n=1 Tax=Parnassius apollo TaxID=110799 RepID=A0A8S3XQU7_PARAO|nr:unnamed protein product [Parnassius apollo]